MPDISRIDKNFRINNELGLDDIYFYDVKENPWCLFGLVYDDLFRRMPEAVAKNVNDGVQSLHTNTSGGRVRFSTNSEYIAIRTVMPDQVAFPHMPSTGVSGFDMYIDGKYVRTFIPPVDLQGGFEAVHHLYDDNEREIMIHFPLYNNVKELYIGLKKGSKFKEHTHYKNPEKIVYYGSSITQGGCVSRPGLSYTAQVAMKINSDFVNLGFSGSAKGELVMAEYIAGLNPDILVMDYDHNAPTPEFLEKTHEAFINTFRKCQKSTPIIFLSAPNAWFWGEEGETRRNIVYRTYKNAVDSGDRNVYFIDGRDLWGNEDPWECSVDGTHPNDIGHYRMARCLIPVIQNILRKE